LGGQRSPDIRAVVSFLHIIDLFLDKIVTKNCMGGAGYQRGDPSRMRGSAGESRRRKREKK
jgi:hypothetical protein